MAPKPPKFKPMEKEKAGFASHFRRSAYFPSHHRLTAVLGADVGPPVRGFKRYSALAASACRQRAADNSVLVFLEFPNCQSPRAYGWAYLTLTRKGWHLWASHPV
jgi:hypothetical protein